MSNSHPKYRPDIDGLSEIVQELKTRGVHRIVLIGPVPIWKNTLSRKIYEYFIVHGNVPSKMVYGLREENIFDIDKKLSLLATSEKFEYVSSLEVLCDSSGCLTSIDSENGSRVLTTFDGVHLTATAAKYLLAKLNSRYSLVR